MGVSRNPSQAKNRCFYHLRNLGGLKPLWTHCALLLQMKNSNIPVWHILKEPHLRCGMEFQNLLCLLLFSALWKTYYMALFKKFHRIVFSLYFSKGKIHISFLDFRILVFTVMCPCRHLKLGGHFDFSFWTKTNPTCHDLPKRWFYRPHSGFFVTAET